MDIDSGAAASCLTALLLAATMRDRYVPDDQSGAHPGAYQRGGGEIVN